jgi:hypothetical protein
VKCGVLGPPLWTLLTDKHWLGEFFSHGSDEYIPHNNLMV